MLSVELLFHFVRSRSSSVAVSYRRDLSFCRALQTTSASFGGTPVNRDGSLCQDSDEDVGDGVRGKRRCAREQFVQHHAEAEDVRLVVDLRAASLLGRHELRRADQHAAAASDREARWRLSLADSVGPDSLAMPKSSSLTRPWREPSRCRA